MFMLIMCFCMESCLYGRYSWGGEEVIIANVPVGVVKASSKEKGEKKVSILKYYFYHV